MTAPQQIELGEELEAELDNALPGIEFSKWGYYWPFTMALWRFLRRRRPAYFDDLDTSFVREPTYCGRPAKWFCEQLLNDREILDPMDTFMRRIAEKLASMPQVRQRGFALRTDLPAFDSDICSRIAARALA